MNDQIQNNFPLSKRTQIILSVFQYFYLFCAIIALIAFIFSAITGDITIALLAPTIVAALISYGIFNKKSWTILVVTLLCAFAIVNNILTLASDTILSLIIIGILIFEIYFFNRTDVRQRFGLKSIIMF